MAPGQRNGTSRWVFFNVFALAVVALFITMSLAAPPKAHPATNWTRTYTCTSSNATIVNDMVQYGSHLYTALGRGDIAHTRVNRYNGGTSWTQINTTDFGDSGNTGALSLADFNGQLYCGTANGNTGTEVWAYNGSSWTQVNIDGFGDNQLWDCNRLCVYNSTLYAGIASSYDGCRIFRYNGGTSWNQINTQGFGDSENDYALSMTSWNGYLWCGTENTTTGSEVWRYDGSNWIRVNTDGFGISEISSTMTLAAYSNVLCAGVYAGPSTKTKALRYNGGTNWNRIDNGDFANSEGGISSMTIFNGKLFSGVYQSIEGCGIWSYNGSSWTQENEAGFGQSSNTDASAICIFGSQLYVGAKNFNGAQVWRSGGTTPTSFSVYLAEGTTDWGFDEYISIENPGISTANVSLTYQTKGGPITGPAISMAPKSQTTVNPRETVGNTDFSTKVICTNGKTISADRTMTWNAGSGEEGHCAIGITSPAKTWYLAEGSSAWGFECYLLIQNPGTSPANCTLTYMVEGGSPITVPVQVPAGSRGTWNIADHIGSRDASIKVTSDQNVIPERAMYRNNRREGHDSTGTTTPANDYYLAEGAIGYDVGYITYVLVQNPNDNPADVSLVYMTGAGQIAGPSFQMAANSRKTIRVNDQLPPGTDVSTKVHGSQPIIAERAMYWNNGTGEACHDSIGMNAAHTTFYLPDGETSNGRETWTLVQNPNTRSVTVEITYLTPTGTGNVTKTETIAGNSRQSFNMLSHSGINGRASIMVTSKTSGAKIMCERAMYWNNRGAGTDTIGGYSD